MSDACQTCAPYAIYHTVAAHHKFMMKVTKFSHGLTHDLYGLEQNNFTPINLPPQGTSDPEPQDEIVKEYAGLRQPMIDVIKLADQTLSVEKEVSARESPDREILAVVASESNEVPVIHLTTCLYDFISAEESTLALTLNEACEVFGIKENVVTVKAEIKQYYDDMKDYLFRHYTVYGMPTCEEGVGKIEELEVAYAVLKCYQSVTWRSKEIPKKTPATKKPSPRKVSGENESPKKAPATKKPSSRKVSGENDDKTATPKEKTTVKGKAAPKKGSSDNVEVTEKDPKKIPLMSEVVAKVVAKKRAPAKKKAVTPAVPSDDKLEETSPEGKLVLKKKAAPRKKAVAKTGTPSSPEGATAKAGKKRPSTNVDKPELAVKKRTKVDSGIEGMGLSKTKAKTVPTSESPTHIDTASDGAFARSDASVSSYASALSQKRAHDKGEGEGEDGSPSLKRARISGAYTTDGADQIIGESEVDVGAEADVEDEDGGACE